MRSIEFLDRPFVQASAFHLLVGKKGNFKGTWLAHLIARVTRGELHGQPRQVLVVSSEDSASVDLKPRVVAAAGNPNLVAIVKSDFLLPRDIEPLKKTVADLQVGLLIIDPIANHVGGTDTNQESAVRDAISRLNEVADELDCTIFGIRHLSKDVSKGALASVLGSTAWTDTPRAVLACAIDDEDELLFHLQVIAGNRGPRNEAGRTYTVDLVTLTGLNEPVTRATPGAASTKNMDELLDRRDQPHKSSSHTARELILDLLETNGRTESDTLDAEVAQQTGLAAKTIRNLRAELRKDGLISAIPDKDEHGQVQRWLAARTAAPRPPRDLDTVATKLDPDQTTDTTEPTQPSHIPTTSLDREREDLDDTKDQENTPTSRPPLSKALAEDIESDQTATSATCAQKKGDPLQALFGRGSEL
ncbi:MAG TPA: AAA family ATPase [Gaiellaceae bacterium]|nr:AAA family ATPase [Gaiellaceae bacterium]